MPLLDIQQGGEEHHARQRSPGRAGSVPTQTKDEQHPHPSQQGRRETQSDSVYSATAKLDDYSAQPVVQRWFAQHLGEKPVARFQHRA